MEWWMILGLIFCALMLLFIIGVPVAFAFLFINIIGVYLLWGGQAGLNQLVLSIYRSVSTFSLLPVPLFILMGEIMFRAGIAPKMMDTLDKWIGRIPGRLSLLAVGGGTLFSTLSGSAMAGCAMLGSVLVPEMEKRGYKKAMSIGPIIGSGGLAIMIPPSALGVLLASLSRISVGGMLMAIIIPGIIMALLYAGYIILRACLQPDLAPSYRIEKVTLAEKLMLTLRYVLPLGTIVFLVIGLMFIGIATPTESAALGALGCFGLVFIYRGWNWEVIKGSVSATLRITVMMFMIMTGAMAFSQILAFSGASSGLVSLAGSVELPPMMILIFMQVILLFMGIFMEPLTIMMVTLPIYMPIVKALGFDPLWFGTIMLINMEMATTTPPFGLVLFVMKGVAPPDTKMGDIYKAGLPFLLCDAIAMGLIMAFPSLALYLPSLM
ncbi:MAG: TRAP transporter large permease subunit [Deltaproteobacteria bacterium]|nr:TRAP transporter large permease subunit [Deltaproteobacteria bacterium]MBW2128953.1 TRAP transporter large permease subunit [Deltaproteobacteria bacterium]MBW2302765.1 TRAP transporter large permease subunit [Deltaproteobacteria bacterium]